MSNRFLLIPVYPSSADSLKNFYETMPEELSITDKTLEEIILSSDWATLQNYANQSKEQNRSLVIFVNHEMVKWEHFDYFDDKGKHITNILEELDKLNLSEIILVDAGLVLNPTQSYRTKFTKYVANIWISQSHELIPPCEVDQWVFYHMTDSLCHILEDLDYIRYPCYSFLSRVKLHRILFYAEANKYGWWQNNPYLTYNNCNLFGEENSPALCRDVAETYYKDNSEIYNLLNNFSNNPQETAPSEHYFKHDYHYPFTISGTIIHPSIRTFQETLISISAESVTETDNYFITEKTFQPIWNLCPVTVYGQQGVNEYLTNMGFDMFPDIIDWTKFDHIQDTAERCFAFTSTVNEFIENFDSVLNNLKADKQKYYSRVRHNFKLLWKLKEIMPREVLHRPTSLLSNDTTRQENLIQRRN